MRFLNIKILKQELRTGSLTENDAFAYFFAMFILETLFINGSFVFSSEAGYSLLNVTSILVPTFIAVAVTWLLYQANGGKKGWSFFLRYFSILWVMGVRFFLLSLFVFASWFTYLCISGDDYEYEWEYFAVESSCMQFFIGVFGCICERCRLKLHPNPAFKRDALKRAP